MSAGNVPPPDRLSGPRPPSVVTPVPSNGITVGQRARPAPVDVPPWYRAFRLTAWLVAGVGVVAVLADGKLW